MVRFYTYELVNGCNSISDTETDLLYGDEVCQLAEETSAGSSMNAKADAVLEECLELWIEWAGAAKVQHPLKE
ncbi:hypothetical protein ON010_g220 [Phytophthora cinnamomi]|nr:hypothetical protein ON010_g220 [Phytophthora cinnamomi]